MSFLKHTFMQTDREQRLHPQYIPKKKNRMDGARKRGREEKNVHK